MHIRSLALVCAMALVACGSEDGVSGSSSPDDPVEDVAEEGAPSTREREPGQAPDARSTPASAEAPKLGPPYPIVLLHGMGGFGKLEVGAIEVTYFKGVVEDLTKNGEAVYVTIAPPYATSEVRAEAIAKQIDRILGRTGKAKVNLIGHSQGGLDARVIASPNGLGYGDRVASVTTIATPHRGSKVADAVLGLLKHLPNKVVDDVTDAILKLLQKTAYELQNDPDLRQQLVLLSEEHMTKVFNPKYVDDPNVVYKSYAGRSNLRSGVLACAGSVYPNEPTKLDAVQPMLWPTALFLEEGGSKVNDGLVTVESSKWGTFEQCVPADHLKEVGQLGPAAASFDHIALFRSIVERLRNEGL